MTRKTIPISQLKPSSIRHEELPLSLIARINYLHQTLSEVFPQSIEKWMDGFKRDANPESEVVWWERMTRCYLAYSEPKDLSFKQRHAAFKILFSLGMGNDISGTKTELAVLPDGAEQEILAMMGGRTQ
jgi:hypothetical protein